MIEDPFAALGLPARAGLADEDVRAAWRRIAAATHPDRDDGGDPARFGAAAAAYDTLRTSFGRGEALADLGLAGRAPRPARQWARSTGRQWIRGTGRHWVRSTARHARRTGVPRLSVGGRWWRRALPAAVGGGVTAAAILAVGWTPATIGLLAGALTWVAAVSRPGPRGHGNE